MHITLKCRAQFFMTAQNTAAPALCRRALPQRRLRLNMLRRTAHVVGDGYHSIARLLLQQAHLCIKPAPGFGITIISLTAYKKRRCIIDKYLYDMYNIDNLKYEENYGHLRLC